MITYEVEFKTNDGKKHARTFSTNDNGCCLFRGVGASQIFYDSGYHDEKYAKRIMRNLIVREMSIDCLTITGRMKWF